MILIPPEYVTLDGPVVFLAGPIQGTYNWQRTAAVRIDRPGLIVASPRDVTAGEFAAKLNDANHFDQVKWEHDHLAEAANYGVLMFWLARETEHLCERAYAQTTRFELGEHVGRYYDAGSNIVVGIEPGFAGGEYIEHTLRCKYPRVPIFSTLDETCQRVSEIARQIGAYEV